MPENELPSGGFLPENKLDLFFEPPKIAVVCPTYNSAHYINRTLDTLLSQQEMPEEVIFSDDGSDDNTVSIIEKNHERFKQNGIELKILCNPHKGPGAARNQGIFATELPWVAFLDADNWYRQDHISNLLEALDHQKADFASSGRTLCRLDGSVMGPCPLTNPQTFIDTNAMLFGRTAFHLLHQWVLMPDYGHLIGDRIMLHHVHKSDLKHQHIHEDSVFYRCNKAGLYRQLNESIPSQVGPQPNYAASFKKWKADGNEPL